MFHCMSAKDVNINLHNFTCKYWINFPLFWFGSNTRLPSFKFIAPAVLQSNKCQKIKRILPKVFPNHFVPQPLMPQKQLNLTHFNCLLNNKNKHSSAYKIWTLGVAEGLRGVKSGQKWNIRSGMLIGKNGCWKKCKHFLPRMIRFVLLKRKAKFLGSQRLEHAEDKNDQADNQETRVLILALH